MTRAFEETMREEDVDVRECNSAIDHCEYSIVKGDFKGDVVKDHVLSLLKEKGAPFVKVFIAYALFGVNLHPWDKPEHAWGEEDFAGVFAFAR